MQAGLLENNRWYKFWKDQETPLTREINPSYRTQFAKEMLVLLGDVQGKRVLEFGCGNGLMFEPYGFDKTDYLGVDFSDSLLADFRQRYSNVKLQNSPAENFITSEKFDLIFSCGMIQYLSPVLLDKHLGNIKKMLKKDGKAILASILWKSAKISYLRNDQGKGNSKLKLIAAYLKRIVNDDAGYWYSMSTLKALAKKNGLSCTIYGSLHYPYRIHLVLG
jgi:cyclopropane fatty-acyl-phospholipid synthase-like methyltransferase